MGRFDGRIAVVTGAAQGTGQGIATRFAEEGAGVAVLDLDEGRAAESAASLPAGEGQRHVGIGCDVSDAASVQAAVDGVVADLGGLHILSTTPGSPATTCCSRCPTTTGTRSSGSTCVAPS